MIDLGSKSTGTNIDSGIWLKLSKGSGVKIGSGIGSKSRSWNSDPHSFSHNGMWLCKIGDSSSRMIGMGIKTDSKMLLKLSNKRGVNIDSEIWTGSQNWGSGSHPVWVQFYWNENLPNCQWDSQKYDIGQVQDVDLERLVIQFHDI